MMVGIFVAFAQEDAGCAEEINSGLEAKGYGVWREPKEVSSESILYARTIENGILGSAAVILVWSSHAAQSEWVERELRFAQEFRKLVVPVMLDETTLPNTLLSNHVVAGQNGCADAVNRLPQDFPAPDSQDALIRLCEQAAHEFIRVRKEAIDLAAEMLQRGEHREEVLAVLEYLARNDLMMGVGEKARKVLDADAQRNVSQPPADAARYIFGVRCRNGHVNYFDKRRVCSEKSSFLRRKTERAGVELDEIILNCATAGCGEKMMVRIDCEGYR